MFTIIIFTIYKINNNVQILHLPHAICAFKSKREICFENLKINVSYYEIKGKNFQLFRDNKQNMRLKIDLFLRNTYM